MQSPYPNSLRSKAFGLASGMLATKLIELGVPPLTIDQTSAVKSIYQFLLLTTPSCNSSHIEVTCFTITSAAVT
ncbi:hypothetical protein [Pseudomonas japonica]|uniref:hypothetical protein n=1 Tax=Pseudomonas japonica TaxID=256466 RepID=UPI0011317DAF|nr:hypothetical protein [Pseudomonas japonica]